MSSLASTFRSKLLLFSLISCFSMPMNIVDKAVTENGVLSPSIRHQRVYVDILGGSEKLEKEKGRCGGGR